MLNRKCVWIILYLLACLVSSIPVMILTSPIVEDGVGTMALAAYVSGYDWSAFLAQDGYFYKYGQAIWYIVPFAVFENPIVTYRVMLFVNSLLVAFIPVICFYLSKKHCGMDAKKAFAIALAVGFYPAILLYSKYTWAESVLCLMPWVLILIFSKLLGDNLSDDSRKVYSCLLAITSVYAFMSHQRGLVIVIATIVVVLFCDGNKHVSRVHFFATLVICMIIDSIVCRVLKQYVYGGAVLKHNTLSDFLKSEIYTKLLSIEGITVIVRTVLGWLFHSATSTFGLALIALNIMVITVCTAIRNKHRVHYIDLFVLLVFMGDMALGVIFFFLGNYEYWYIGGIERSDHLIFGRYTESIMPVLVWYALCRLIDDRGIRSTRCVKMISFAELLLLVAYYGVRIMPVMDGAKVYVHSLMSINLFMDMSRVTNTLDYVPEIGRACLMFGIVSIVIMAVIMLLDRFGLHTVVSVILITMFMAVYIRNVIDVQYRVDVAKETKYARFYLEQGDV